VIGSWGGFLEGLSTAIGCFFGLLERDGRDDGYDSVRGGEIVEAQILGNLGSRVVVMSWEGAVGAVPV